MVILINILGLAAIVFIIGWFWLYQPKATRFGKQKKITIEVANGVYTPAIITIDANQNTILHFLRKDPTPCAEMVLFPELNLSQELPLNEMAEIALPGLAPNEYEFTCQMAMYRGKLIVK